MLEVEKSVPWYIKFVDVEKSGLEGVVGLERVSDDLVVSPKLPSGPQGCPQETTSRMASFRGHLRSKVSSCAKYRRRELGAIKTGCTFFSSERHWGVIAMEIGCFRGCGCPKCAG